MDQVIHGVNNKKNIFTLSNYSLTAQIIIINLSAAFFALIFLIIFNLYLLINNQNVENQKKFIEDKLDLITDYLVKNAIKRPYSFDDTCSGIIIEKKTNCDLKNTVNKNIQDNPPELDPTFTQKYIYSNFSNVGIIIKVFDDNLTKYADTNNIFPIQEEIIISDIVDVNTLEFKENLNLYTYYKNIYFMLYNYINKNFIINKLKKLKNETIIVIETIKAQQNTSFIYKDVNENIIISFAQPIKKDNRIYGVVSINAPLIFDDDSSASKSLLLTNFFLFFLSIVSCLSLLFSKSIVSPIRTLSKNTQLEKIKSTKNKNNILYPNRRDEIGILSSDIKNMSIDLKKRIDEMEEFTSDVSHELKNPLAGLKSSIDLLKNKKLDNLKKDLLIKNMGQDIDRMNILISDIANYTLTGVEISEEVLEKVELISLLNNFKNSLSNKNFSLQINTKEKEIFLRINKNKFLQVMHNILDNSSTYTPLNSSILLFVKLKDEICVIHFVDQGPGVNLEYKDKIFQRFYTDRLKDKNTHSGLGLSISKKIIESLGGSICLIKSPHLGFEGACLEIKLPLKDL
jgi:two-component system sensor histidine kinase ChvG